MGMINIAVLAIINIKLLNITKQQLDIHRYKLTSMWIVHNFIVYDYMHQLHTYILPLIYAVRFNLNHRYPHGSSNNYCFSVGFTLGLTANIQTKKTKNYALKTSRKRLCHS